jgi:hypothetical protein
MAMYFRLRRKTTAWLDPDGFVRQGAQLAPVMKGGYDFRLHLFWPCLRVDMLGA